MVTGSHDKTVKLWNMDLGKEIRTFYGLSEAVFDLTCDFKNNLLVASDHSDMVKIWNLATGEEIATFSESLVMKIALSSDKKFMLTATVDCDIKLWDLEKKEIIKDFDDHSFDISTLFLDQNNQPFLAEVSENTVSIWNLTQKKAYRSFSDQTDELTAIAVSLDNRYIVAGSQDHSIKAWNIETEE